MEDYEEMLLQISEVMRAHNKLRGGITHEEAIEYIRNIVGYNKLLENGMNVIKCKECKYSERFIDPYTGKERYACTDKRGHIVDPFFGDISTIIDVGCEKGEKA